MRSGDDGMITSVGDETRDVEGISAWSLQAAPELSQERKTENRVRKQDKRMEKL